MRRADGRAGEGRRGAARRARAAGADGRGKKRRKACVARRIVEAPSCENGNAIIDRSGNSFLCLIHGARALFCCSPRSRRSGGMSPVVAPDRAPGGCRLVSAASLLVLRGASSSPRRCSPRSALVGLNARSGRLEFRPRPGARRGGMSPVRSAMIEMELDHGTGAMNGTILAGPLQGRSLDTLTRPDCESLPPCLSRRSGRRAPVRGVSGPPVCRMASGRRG